MTITTGELKEFIKSLSAKERNMGLAIFGIGYTHKNFPEGAVNRMETYQRMRWDSWAEAFKNATLYRDSLKKGDAFNIPKPKAFFCGELAMTALLGIRLLVNELQLDVPVEIATLDDHQFVVIDRLKDSKLECIETWGADAVICDPWSGKFYGCDAFFNQQKTGEQIKAISGFGFFEDRPFIKLSEKNYLEGNPSIQNI